MINVPEMFGSMVFNDREMKKRLSPGVYSALNTTVQQGAELTLNVADEVASAMKDWAIEKGATHFTHWFQPMTGLPAEKHDSFIEPEKDGSVIMEFSGKELIKGEPDASSFPSGGIRETCEARGYTAWDPTSYAFIRGTTLYIPTCFISFTGEVLDKKTPLLRSKEAVESAALKLVKLCGFDCSGVNVSCGAEQEYFLIDRDLYNARKDLIYTGRTLFGAPPPKGQELEDQYFGSISPRVMDFMEDIDSELWKLGIPSKTRHNETAPCQHEIAPVYTEVNVSADHNLLIMETLKNVAERHGLVCLLHEKPFKGVNGSGKHNNWSLNTYDGINLFNPGPDPENNILFLISVAAVLQAVNRHADLLRLSVSSAGNDYRLGGNEAPPAIISVFLGDHIKGVFDAVESGCAFEKKINTKTAIKVHAVPDFEKDTADRNRTSPFAFTGNKFEFRALGSALNISCPNTMLNIAVAESLDEIVSVLSAPSDKPFECRATELIKKIYSENKRIVFNGNNYSREWVETESKKRGLKEIKSTPEALSYYTDEKNIKLFAKYGLFTKRECEARMNILLSQYAKVINIEAHTMFKMISKEVLPASVHFMNDLSKSIKNKCGIGNMSCVYEKDTLSRVSNLTDTAYMLNNELEKLRNNAASLESVPDQCTMLKDKVIAKMEELRSIIDELELLVGREYWPFPSYGDMLFMN